MNATSTTDSTYLPSRLKESSFRRYEGVIAQIVDEYPFVVKIDHGDLSPATFSARLRDAMSSLFVNRWTTTKIDVLKFSEEYFHIIVSQRANGVFAGSREAIKNLEQANQFDVTSLPTTNPCEPYSVLANEVTPLELNNLTRDEVKFLCLLASKSAFTRPIELTAEWMDDENLEWFLGNFDVMLERSKDATKQHTFILT